MCICIYFKSYFSEKKWRRIGCLAVGIVLAILFANKGTRNTSKMPVTYVMNSVCINCIKRFLKKFRPKPMGHAPGGFKHWHTGCVRLRFPFVFAHRLSLTHFTCSINSFYLLLCLETLANIVCDGNHTRHAHHRPW